MAMKVALSEIQERQLVIAIDYGTTYTGIVAPTSAMRSLELTFQTGIAYATPIGNRADLSEIHIYRGWDDVMDNCDKVPSIISYSPPSDRQELQWGASLSPEAIAMVHTKLALDIEDTSVELDLISEALDGMRNLHFGYIKEAVRSWRQYTWKRPEEIVEDYLSKIFDSFHKHIYNNTHIARITIPVYIVVTIPTMCSYRAKNSMFRAITGAGFNKDAFPMLKEILLLSEPEAAAIHVAGYLKEQQRANLLLKDECFILCDAGGATVDLVSYKVKELEPTLELEARTIPMGQKCGSIFINLAFKKWLRALLGEKNYMRLDQTHLTYKISSHSSEGQHMRRLMGDFDSLKKNFYRDHRDMKIDLPPPLENLHLENRVSYGEITITNADMKSFFDPCIDSIIEMIHGQISQIERLKIRAKNVFLVGGLAESKYLQEEIQFSLQLKGITLLRPDTSWTAVVRGAAVFGIEHSATRTPSNIYGCPRSFGAAVTKLSSDIEYRNQDLITDPITGWSVAKGQLMWFIKKGDLILSKQPRVVKYQLTKNFTEKDPRKGRMHIYAYDDIDVPESLSVSQDELDIISTLEYDLTGIPMQEFTRRLPSGGILSVHVASLTLIARFEPPLLKVQLCWNDKTLCGTEINCL